MGTSIRWFVCGVLVWVALGCGESGEDIPTHTLYGRLDYTIFAIVDLNDNISYDLLIPDSGDPISSGRALILWEKTEINFDDDAWRTVP